MTTLDKNKLLAKFAGVELLNFGKSVGNIFYLNDSNIWQPDKDLNQLMLVVEKIREQINSIEISVRYDTTIVYIDVDESTELRVKNKSLHKALFDACVEYVTIKSK